MFAIVILQHIMKENTQSPGGNSYIDNEYFETRGKHIIYLVLKVSKNRGICNLIRSDTTVFLIYKSYSSIPHKKSEDKGANLMSTNLKPPQYIKRGHNSKIIDILLMIP